MCFSTSSNNRKEADLQYVATCGLFFLNIKNAVLMALPLTWLGVAHVAANQI